VIDSGAGEHQVLLRPLLKVAFTLVPDGIVAAVVWRPGTRHQARGDDGGGLEVIEKLFFPDVIVLQLLVHATLCTVAASPAPRIAATLRHFTHPLQRDKLRSMIALRLIVAAALIVTTRPLAGAQAPPADVQIVTTKLTDALYVIDGQGGRIGVLAGPDGIFIVDAQFPQVAERVAAAIRQISPGPLRFLVNTHVHGDHTGGNEHFARLGAAVIARPMLRQRLLTPSSPAAGGAAPAPAPAAALPVMIYDTRTTVHMNGEGIQLIPLPLAHTDGDTAVRFPVADAVMTGDVFRSIGYPNIDRANGGSLAGMLAAFDILLDAAGPATKVIPGHGPIAGRAAIAAHKTMVIAVRDRVARLVKDGQTLPQILAAKVTADYDTATGNAAGSADRFVGQLYAELGGQ